MTHFNLRSFSMGVLVAVMLVPIFSAALPAGHANALAGSDFKAGNIISDAIFTNKGAMTAAEIQAFLNSQASGCDTNGTTNKTYHYDSGSGRINNGADPTVTTSRAVYGQRYDTYNNTSAAGGPYVCLNNYLENPTTHANNLQTTTLNVPGGLSAAQIIFNAAQSYGINPQVLLVTLQKEQGLVTDSWPWTSEYRIAMGYACPDSGSCNSAYYGFYNQVTNAAMQFRKYLNNPNNYNYVVGTNNILYNPSASCGSSSVNISDQSTAALYDYTPYQPNAAALNNLNGSGDSCSAYGNRNFWYYFNIWFGTPTAQVQLPGCDSAAFQCVWRLYNPANAQQFLTSSSSERYNLVELNGYSYEGVAFYSANATGPGAIPIYRLNNTSNGNHYWTADSAEVTSLTNNGYTNEGVAYYGYPTTSNNGYPVFKLYYAPLQKYLWTTSGAEAANLVAAGYVNQGAVFESESGMVGSDPAPTNQYSVYRLYSPALRQHMWTISIFERDNLLLGGYRYEGVSTYASSNSNSSPVYRLYSPLTYEHFLTSSTNERDSLLRVGYISEGTAFYGSPTTTSNPVYRLYSPILKTHFWTTSQAERDALVQQAGYSYEGISWYQP